MGVSKWRHRLFWLISIFALNYSEARGKRINIFAAENGQSDIIQLRDGGSGRNVFRSPSFSRRPTFRNALLSSSSLKWSTMTDADGNFQIPYIITGNFEKVEHDIIQSAIAKIANNSCIRFIPRTSQRDYAEIRNKKGEGCYASIGRFPGKNIVMLESNEEQSCLQEDTVIHELFHVIGLWHEHMRADRDQYIDVIYQNIDASQFPQFEKLSSRDATTYNVPYDYTSVMHYDETAFALPGKISMKTKDSAFQKVIGHPKDASVNDYKKICAIYHCKMCMNQDFDKLVISSNIDLSNPTHNLPNISHTGCKDRLEICAVLKIRGVLNCDVMEKYCCASCASMPPPDRRTTTVAPIFTPAGLWTRITSWFS